MELFIIFMMILTGSILLISIFMLVVYIDVGMLKDEDKKSYKEGFKEFIYLIKIFFKKRITKYTNGRQVK